MVTLGAKTATVVKVTDGTVDRYNSPTATEGTEETYAGCSLQQRTSQENTDGRQVAATTFVLYAPYVAGQTISHVDRVRVDAVTYEIDGHPSLWDDFAGPHHWEVPLRLVEDT